MLYRITSLEKTEIVTLSLYVNGTPSLSFSYEYSKFIFKIFYLLYARYFTKQLQTTDCKGFYLLIMPNNCCFRRAVQGQLSQCNRTNIAAVLREVIKSHNQSQGLKGVKVIACGCSGRNF